ncbi:MGH1-like glycoside hydrolase domain-containing protein [Larkinella soli]|uniref:MGH1-like glycoside hydrolase domain-containing protein n=1 Tax=Larkinella soli TaxID=1770527 RepID=UPI000FFBBE98|nr:trehalase family glycosidase [Larkinella soli]
MNRLTLLLAGLIYHWPAADAQYLSNLKADARFPLYTTYAAAMERSNFVLDEGYHFRFYQADKGADFTTDSGGDWCLGFRRGSRWVGRVQDMHRQPVITKSYPDLVEYEFFPFEDVQATVRFVVYSSTGAVMEVRLRNTGSVPIRLTLVPFLRSASSHFHHVGAEGNTIRFQHEEHPDSWTVGHQLPFADSLRNVFRTADPRSEGLAFNAEGGRSPLPPVRILRDKKAVLQVNGRLYGPSGDRLMDPAPFSRLQMLVDGNPAELITENSPAWGSSQPPIDADGYFRMEAAQLKPDARRFRIGGYNRVLNRSVWVEGSFAERNIRRVDLRLNEDRTIPVVSGLKIRTTGGRNALRWTSAGPGLRYAVYRRDYPATTYRRIAQGLTRPEFTESSPAGERASGYVVVAVDPAGRIGMQSEEVTTYPASDFDAYVRGGLPASFKTPFAAVLALPTPVNLPAGGTYRTRVVRTVQSVKEKPSRMESQTEAGQLLTVDLEAVLKADEKLFANAPKPRLGSADKEALYWSAMAMMRQVFYPAEAKSAHNYYVFSREPTWGWGHGGQVFHESITMLAYAYLDPVSAMNSQRVYARRQYPNGYINYRTGSYLDEVIEEKGELTSSAPWYAWLNYEVYRITKDRDFLKEMYESSKRFYQFYVTQRDKDHDGLCEWGGKAVLESVRDALVAVWDEVGYPTNFESLDLNCMLVMEAKSLEKMAAELGLTEEAARWKTDHETRTARINSTFWDEENGFYYNVNKTDHTFTFKKKDDLKRDEIIGFLPLWAGVAPPEQAKRLVEKLTDPQQFWRPFGVPSLSARDPYYNAKGYWNGPVWVEWDYLIVRGLLDYGYKKEARELTDRVARGMIDVLKKDHNLWEFYSPDEAWGGYHKTYIWAGIINRMMMDTQD